MALASKSPYHQIIALLKTGFYQLPASTEIMLEIEEKIQEKYNVDVADSF